MEPAKRRTYTEEEYLALEERAETKSELVHGKIYPMAGRTLRHNALSANTMAALRPRLLAQGSSCVGFASDQRVHVGTTGLFTYPDVTVACGPRTHPRSSSTIINPVLIVEVLSASTEAYDRGPKFAHYRAIPGFAEYVLVSQGAHRIDHYRRMESGQWLLTAYADDDAVMELPALGCSLPLREIYAGTDDLPGDPDLS